MIAYTARTPGKTKHLFNDGYEPYKYVYLLADKEGRIRISPEDIEIIVKRVLEGMKK